MKPKIVAAPQVLKPGVSVHQVLTTTGKIHKFVTHSIYGALYKLRCVNVASDEDMSSTHMTGHMMVIQCHINIDAMS